ncbi:MFS transporter [Streptomyces sp. NPDC001658]
MTSEANWTSPGDAEQGDPRRWRALGVVLIGTFLILLDSTIVNVAIPSIQQDLSASRSSIEWVISGYSLAYGLLLIPSGRLGDRFGYKRMFLFALAGFTATSALCAVASSPTQLVLWRILQGAMAGFLNPQILAIIQVEFSWQERGKAFGAYGAISGIGVALGPLAAGLLIDWNVADSQWRPIFMVNVPVGIIALLLAGLWLREAKGRAGSLDLVGTLLVSAGVLLLTYPLVEVPENGWEPRSFILLAASVPVLALFVGWELRRQRQGRDALIDVRLFRNRGFTAGVTIGLTYFAGFISLWFVLSIYLQTGTGRGALAAGLILLPFAVGMLIGATLSDLVAKRIGRWVVTAGSSVVIVGTAGAIGTIHGVGTDLAGWHLLPALFVAGFGSGLVISPNTDIVLRYVPWQDAGAASGILNVGQRVGTALGIAIVSVAFFGAVDTGPGPASPAELDRAFTHAVQIGALYALGLVALTFLASLLLPADSPKEQATDWENSTTSESKAEWSQPGQSA